MNIITGLMFLWRPKWHYDPVDKRYCVVDYERVLHFSTTISGKFNWVPVACEEFPDQEGLDRLKKEFPPK